MEVPATQASVGATWVGVTWDRPFNASRSRWTNPSKRSERCQGFVIIPIKPVFPIWLKQVMR